MRLFEAKGFEGTTVAEIAAAAGVSHMTFFRHFPTKEDVALTDDYDPMIARLIRARPVEEGPVARVQHGIAEGFSLIYQADRQTLRRRVGLLLSTASLRARLFGNQSSTEALIAEVIAEDPTFRDDPFGASVIAAACVGAMTTAIVHWSESGDGRELPDLMDEAFATLDRHLATPPQGHDDRDGG